MMMMTLTNEIILKHMPEVGFGLIMGDIRSGKSTIGYSLLEDIGIKNVREMQVFGLPKQKIHLLPPHIKPTYNLNDLHEEGAVLFDEAYKEFYSREHQKNTNKLIDLLAGLAGQKGMLGIFITHQSRKLEIGVVSPLQFLIYKKPSMLQYRFERHALRSLTKEADNAFKKYPKEEAKKHAYVFFPEYTGMVLNSNVAPSWWSEELSKAYAQVPITQKKEENEVQVEEPILSLEEGIYIHFKEEIHPMIHSEVASLLGTTPDKLYDSSRKSDILDKFYSFSIRRKSISDKWTCANGRFSPEDLTAISKKHPNKVYIACNPLLSNAEVDRNV